MFYRVLLIIFFKTLEVNSEQKLIWLNIILDSFWMNINHTFLIYDLPPSIYTFKILFEVLLRKLQSAYGGVNQTMDNE